MSPVIAIVGRPNVGKSALFNRLVGKRIAIVHDMPGVTRDRISAEAEWHGVPYTLVDTGGIGLVPGEKAHDAIQQATIEQVHTAIESAHLTLFVVDGQQGLTPLDEEVARLLRHAAKPVVLVVNKVDNDRMELSVTEFAALGFETMLPVSAVHGRGVDTLMRTAMAVLRKAHGAEALDRSTAGAKQQAPSEPALKVAILGRPNVGKSSIINALTRSNRVIVSPVAGTTRDAVDVPFEIETEGRRESYVLIDTAGLRKARKLESSVEFFSVKRAEKAIERCDIAVLVLDAEGGITEQDKKIGGKIVEARKACVLVVNKWDLVADAVRAAQQKYRRSKTKDPQVMTTLAEFAGWVQQQLFFLDYAPVIFTSAASGYHLEQLLEAIRYVSAQLQQKIPTAVLNRVLHEVVESHQPPSAQGRRLKFYYATQLKQAPPTFLLFVNYVELFSDAYRKFLERQMRKAFGYEGCPIVLVPKPRPRKESTGRDERN